ncbi:HSPB1-associated protein 1 [Nephila pilipes]|uniref:HSPB1-associated protein 1 n=1 Tax=Nephila pilipes TaxID=299642 RepID=A0A8X6KC11_NEPPI|nr:HSPB1-associated protein 1 [Nephila pilipes]
MASLFLYSEMIDQSESFPSPMKLKDMIKSSLDTPVIFKNQIKSWSIPWTTSDFTEKYGSTLLDFRVVPKSYKGISWEAQHKFEEATISQFIAWQNNENSLLDSNNPFKRYQKEEFWSYSSYNYMNSVFPGDSILQAVDWSVFGFPGVTGNESTFWLGSEGANTPCHFDSYGCNLVAQIVGRKKWILFPPTDTAFMYPTRIPYEESSVFSSVNILNPDLSQHVLFKKSHPYIAVLEPGDVLFVPKKWWHFVLSIDEVTISMNTWIKLDSDPQCRLEEGIARALMASLISYYEPEIETWLNPKEELVPPEEALKYINTSMKELNEMKRKNNELDKTAKRTKVCKILEESDVHSGTCKEKVIHDIFSSNYIEKVKSVAFHEWLTDTVQLRSLDAPMSENSNLLKIVNSFVHPDVIAFSERSYKTRKLLDVYNLNSFSAAILHQKDSRNKPTGRYKCSFCYYSTDRTTSFKNHQLVHSGERPYKCPICSFGFTTKQNLRRHLPLHK